MSQYIGSVLVGRTPCKGYGPVPSGTTISADLAEFVCWAGLNAFGQPDPRGPEYVRKQFCLRRKVAWWRPAKKYAVECCMRLLHNGEAEFNFAVYAG